MANGVAYTLKRGHETPFRRTVTSKKGGSELIVFKPGEDFELTSEQLEQCKDIIDTGLLVPADRDEKGRLRTPRVATPDGEWVEAEEMLAKIDELKAKLAASEARVAELEKEVAEYEELTEDDDE